MLPANDCATRKPEGVNAEKRAERKREVEETEEVGEKGEHGKGKTKGGRGVSAARVRETDTWIQICRVGGRCGKSAALRGRLSKDRGRVNEHVIREHPARIWVLARRSRSVRPEHIANCRKPFSPRLSEE